MLQAFLSPIVCALEFGLACFDFPCGFFLSIQVIFFVHFLCLLHSYLILELWYTRLLSVFSSTLLRLFVSVLQHAGFLSLLFFWGERNLFDPILWLMSSPSHYILLGISIKPLIHINMLVVLVFFFGFLLTFIDVHRVHFRRSAGTTISLHNRTCNCPSSVTTLCIRNLPHNDHERPWSI